MDYEKYKNCKPEDATIEFFDCPLCGKDCEAKVYRRVHKDGTVLIKPTFGNPSDWDEEKKDLHREAFLKKYYPSLEDKK